MKILRAPRHECSDPGQPLGVQLPEPPCAGWAPPHPASRQNGAAASRGPGKQRVSLVPKCVFVTGIQKQRIRVALKNKHIALSDVVL